MNNLGLIERLADPELMKQMSTSDKVAGALIVTVLGMLITFIVLLILWGLIAIMTKMMYKPVTQKSAVQPAPAAAPAPAESPAAAVDTEEDEALVAVITAAIAASMQRPIQTIIVKNIKRTENRMPAWANVAKHEQLDSRRV